MDIIDLHRRAHADPRTINGSEIRWLVDKSLRCAVIENAIKVSGWDIERCRECGCLVMCLSEFLMGGLPTCKKCRGEKC